MEKASTSDSGRVSFIACTRYVQILDIIDVELYEPHEKDLKQIRMFDECSS
jgi:hypothetical protein